MLPIIALGEISILTISIDRQVAKEIATGMRRSI